MMMMNKTEFDLELSGFVGGGIGCRRGAGIQSPSIWCSERVYCRWFLRTWLGVGCGDFGGDVRGRREHLNLSQVTASAPFQIAALGPPVLSIDSE